MEVLATAVFAYAALASRRELAPIQTASLVPNDWID
jgi:hypothetical protein